MTVAYISVGSNHDAETNLPEGIALLREKVNVTAVSPVYESAPADDTIDSYLNAAVAIETDMQSADIKSLLVEIEDECGRVRVDAEGNKSKGVALDFDLLLYGESVTIYEFNQKTYRLPHEDVAKVAYVAIPLAHIAPDAVHPETKQTILTIATEFGKSNLILRNDVELNQAG
jgi:2-amino-4-hydroxy-6-hydroxymethyldihydropteridine diphosphokinase